MNFLSLLKKTFTKVTESNHEGTNLTYHKNEVCSCLFQLDLKLGIFVFNLYDS